MEKDPTVELWKASMAGGGGWKSYRWALKKFCEFTGKSPRELIDKRDKEIISPDRAVRYDADNVLISFHKHLLDEGYASGTALFAYTTIRGFYMANDVPILKKKPRSFKRTAENESPPISPKDGQRLLKEATNSRDGAIISLLAESGARPGILTGLKVSDVDGQLDLPVAIIRIPEVLMNPKGENVNKAKFAHKVCVGSRTLKLVKQALRERVWKSEWLFPISVREIQHVVSMAAKRAGLADIAPRSFRKTFNDLAIASKMDPTLKEYLMGHTIDKTRAAYFGGETEIIRKAIVEAYGGLLKVMRDEES